MRRLWRRLLAWLIPDELPEEPPHPDSVPFRLVCPQHLTREQYARNGGRAGGRSNWWLRGREGFVLTDLPRGFEPVDVQLHLLPGRYVLGVGRRGTPGAIRQVVTVPKK